MSIALAQSGGAQYKAGLLRIEAVGNKGPWGKRGSSWKEKKKQNWCAVRESYLVVLEEMGEVRSLICYAASTLLMAYHAAYSSLYTTYS